MTKITGLILAGVLAVPSIAGAQAIRQNGAGINAGVPADFSVIKVSTLTAVDSNGILITDKDGVTTIQVEDGGQVGIGTVNPGTKLHISSGTLLIDGDAATSFQIGASSLTILSDSSIGIGVAPTDGSGFVVIRATSTIDASRVLLVEDSSE